MAARILQGFLNHAQHLGHRVTFQDHILIIRAHNIDCNFRNGLGKRSNHVSQMLLHRAIQNRNSPQAGNRLAHVVTGTVYRSANQGQFLCHLLTGIARDQLRQVLGLELDIAERLGQPIMHVSGDTLAFFQCGCAFGLLIQPCIFQRDRR